MKREPYFTVVRTAAGWHTRLCAANNQPVLTSEVYTRKRAAYRAIEVAREAFYDAGATKWEVREVDERFGPPPSLDDAQALAVWAKAQPTVYAEIKADRKINAIAALRKLTGASLFQSKSAVDILWAPR